MKTSTRILLLMALLLAACSTPNPSPEVLRTVPETPDYDWQQLCPSGDYTAEPQPEGGVLITCYPPATVTATDTETPTPTETATATPEPTSTDTAEPTATETETPAPTETAAPTATLSAPYASAPLCPDHGDEHDTTQFHTIWDSVHGCHYEHEHGENPFTAEVAARFPISLSTFTSGVGHTNPSSPAENTAKHGGMKWQVDLSPPHSTTVGFEGGTVAVCASVVQYHVFGPQSVEFEARQHSAMALLELCKPNVADRGYLAVITLQEYGQRITPYQGRVLLYPDNFLPLYDSARGQYFSTESYGACVGAPRPSLAFYNNTLNANNLTVWTSKPTGPASSPRPPGNTVFNLLSRGRDAYQSMECSDQVHPFTWRWACGGLAYVAAGCRYNNSSTTIHELAGSIPAAWDNQPWDSDRRPGRITGIGFVSRHGEWRPAGLCVQPGFECYPIEMVSAFVGKYSTDLCAVKCSNPTPADTPERDLYFLNGQLVSETTPGAVPSGWIGAEN